MRELIAAIEQMAAAHGVEATPRLVGRYCTHLAGFREALAVKAVRDASRHNSRLPQPQQILARLPKVEQ